VSDKEARREERAPQLGRAPQPPWVPDSVGEHHAAEHRDKDGQAGQVSEPPPHVASAVPVSDCGGDRLAAPAVAPQLQGVRQRGECEPKHDPPWDVVSQVHLERLGARDVVQEPLDDAGDKPAEESGRQHADRVAQPRVREPQSLHDRTVPWSAEHDKRRRRR